MLGIVTIDPEPTFIASGMKPQASFRNALGVAAVLVALPPGHAWADETVAEDESIILAGLTSYEYTRDGAGAVQNLPVFHYSCGSLILSFTEVSVLAGRALPESVRTVNPLGESCRSTLDPALQLNFQVVASVSRQEDDLTVSWLTFKSSNDDGIGVIGWTAALDERYGAQLEKRFWCDELAPEDQADPPSLNDPSCYEVLFDDFVQMLTQ